VEYQGKGALARGTRLGKYEIERLIGVGSMGAIYRGVLTETGKRYAIKVLSPVLAAVPNVRARFLEEAKLTARVRHPHVIDVTDVGEEDGRSYFAMEMLEGEDLSRRLQRRGSLSVVETVEILRPVCDAVAEANRRGITHRDLKPSNIYLSLREGRLHPVVLDFGIAKDDAGTNAADAAGVPARAAMFGTPYYLSPEQVADHRAAGPASDQYALGVILYECLTGQPPFGGDSLEDVSLAILAGNAPAPSTHRPEVPHALDAVVLRALNLDPKARFESVAALGEALLPFAPKPGVSAPALRRPTPSSPAITLEALTRSPFTRTLTPEVQALTPEVQAVTPQVQALPRGVQTMPEGQKPEGQKPEGGQTPDGHLNDGHMNEAWFAAGDAMGENSGSTARGELARSREWPATGESPTSRKIRIGAVAGVAVAGLVLVFVATRGGSSESPDMPPAALVQSAPAPAKTSADNAAPPAVAEEKPAAERPMPTALLPPAPAPSEPPPPPAPSAPPAAAPTAAAPSAPTAAPPPAAAPPARRPTVTASNEPAPRDPSPAAAVRSAPPAAVRPSDPRPAATPAHAADSSRARKAASSPRPRASGGIRMHNGVPLLD